MNAQPIDASVALPDADPFPSLAALRRRHSVLLRAKQSENEADRPRLEELIQFIAQIKVTGRNLASEPTREAAQNLMDYWGSVVLAKQPDAFSYFGFLGLDPYEASAEPSSAQSYTPGPEKLAQANAVLRDTAEQLHRSLDPKGQEALRVVLMRLISIGANSMEISLAPLPLRDPLLQIAGPNRMVNLLKKAGVLKTEGEGTSLSYVLGNPALLVEWQLLKQICDDRKSLREMASGWDKAGRPKAALLNRSAQLKRAKDLTNLNPIELEFVEASRSQAEKMFRFTVGTSFLLFLIGAAVLFTAYIRVGAQRNTALKNLAGLEDALTVAQGALGELTNVQQELQTMHEEDESLRKENGELVAEIKKLRPATPVRPVAVLPPESRIRTMRNLTNSIDMYQKDVSKLIRQYPSAIRPRTAVREPR